MQSLHCPTCRKIVLRTDPEFPFCSERCRLLDLGKWASGGYVISSPLDRGDESGEADYTTGQAQRVRPDGHGKDRER
ncbi:MAG: DNA gyrase inhibitor YacG [Terriglobales bacterium]